MRKTRFLIFTMIFLGLSINADAQFLKNLKKQVVDKTKEAIIDKTANKVSESISDKVSDQVSGAIDNALGANWEDIIGPIGNAKDIESLPATYSFDHIYSLNMKTGEGEFPVDYYLSNNSSYMGAKFNVANNMMMVFDEENKALITILDGRAFATELSLDVETDDINSDGSEKYEITNLPNKTFLGYDCIGRLIENDEYKISIYFAPSTEVSFAKVFNSRYSKMPKQMDLSSSNAQDGMVMYSEIIDKTKNNSTVTMICTAFDKTDLVINTR